MSPLDRVLIAGTGPAAIQLAVLLKRWRGSRVGIAGRSSVRSEPFFTALRHNGSLLTAEESKPQLAPFAGECRLDACYHGFASVEGEWDTLLLAVTADAYLPVLSQLKPEVVRNLQCVALLSPTFGSNALVRQYLEEQGASAETISFSTYLGDTRLAAGNDPTRVRTAAIKRKVYAGSSRTSSGGARDGLAAFRELYAQTGLALEASLSALEAETRNISLYVHPPLFMNEIALEAVFGPPAAPRYVYKLFPEGPITQTLIREMLAQWREISLLAGPLGVRALNLLQFMVDDNYPLRPESLARDDIDRFMTLEPIHQQYLLFVRYASLLIDPYSEPDSDGRYFDFSAVPIRRVFVNHEGEWDIPRMPKEDYYRLKIIQGIARRADSPCPTIDMFVRRYEQYLLERRPYMDEHPRSVAFEPQSFEEEIGRIVIGLSLQHTDQT
ncbi:opine metallophore biosynthesis dehydrogenase [Paenibacillus sp. 1P07SE]|uniref:opine metallophore biosynthesis dehydrogenase n=1 Tax=Paenibacillus sp. 1P07SE TaxID=3132209 RepID=UPI0039A404F5